MEKKNKKKNVTTTTTTTDKTTKRTRRSSFPVKHRLRRLRGLLKNWAHRKMLDSPLRA